MPDGHKVHPVSMSCKQKKPHIATRVVYSIKYSSLKVRSPTHNARAFPKLALFESPSQGRPGVGRQEALTGTQELETLAWSGSSPRLHRRRVCWGMAGLREASRTQGLSLGWGWSYREQDSCPDWRLGCRVGSDPGGVDGLRQENRPVCLSVCPSIRRSVHPPIHKHSEHQL